MMIWTFFIFSLILTHQTSCANVRLKRQFFKPSVDGVILGSEKQTSIRSADNSVRRAEPPHVNNSSFQNYIDQSAPNATKTNVSAITTKDGPPDEPITVSDLAATLILVFDKVRAGLCSLAQNHSSCLTAN